MRKHRMQNLRVYEGTHRLEAFTDGVIAIAITLLVLNLQVPNLASALQQGLWGALLNQWPRYLSFLISFVVIGIVWANNQELYRFIVRSNHIFVLLSLLGLMFVTLIPFSASLMGQYLMESKYQVTAVAVYNGTVFMMSFSLNALWRYALRGDLVDDRCDPEMVRSLTRGYSLGPPLFGLAFILSFVYYPVSLVVNALTNFIFLIPSSKRPINMVNPDE
jgi:uncharacterized membrane protein